MIPTIHSGTYYSLLIGVAAYQRLPTLSRATTDARDLHDLLLRSGYAAANLGLLQDGQATKAAISDKLDWLARRATPDDTVLVFFSGHGAQRTGGFEPGELPLSGGGRLVQPAGHGHLRRGVHRRPDFEILCKELSLDYHDLRGEVLKQKMLYLIDREQRRRYAQLVGRVLKDHPHLAEKLQ